MRTGPRNLITDVPGLLVGNASDARLKSGVTVLTAAAPFLASVDVRGSAPGTRETDLLAPGRLVEAVDALVLAGGSVFGLDAASGVVDGLRAMGRGYKAGPALVPIVPAAILFDLANGGDKDWTVNPYAALGRAALAAAGEDFAIGSEGAGKGAMSASLMGGLGSASQVLDDGATVGALVAVNPHGSVTLPDSRAFWAGAFEIGEEFGGLGQQPVRLAEIGTPPRKSGFGGPRANTTIAIVATDVRLDKAAARHMAEVAQNGMARAIHPAHTPYDGDLIFAVSTGTRALGADAGAARLALEQAAVACLARAIARAVHAARPMPGNLLPCWCEIAG
jgi:D-aminopeptidase